MSHFSISTSLIFYKVLLTDDLLDLLDLVDRLTLVIPDFMIDEDLFWLWSVGI